MTFTLCRYITVHCLYNYPCLLVYDHYFDDQTKIAKYKGTTNIYGHVQIYFAVLPDAVQDAKGRPNSLLFRGVFW